MNISQIKSWTAGHKVFPPSLKDPLFVFVHWRFQVPTLHFQTFSPQQMNMKKAFWCLMPCAILHIESQASKWSNNKGNTTLRWNVLWRKFHNVEYWHETWHPCQPLGDDLNFVIACQWLPTRHSFFFFNGLKIKAWVHGTELSPKISSNSSYHV